MDVIQAPAASKTHRQGYQSEYLFACSRSGGLVWAPLKRFAERAQARLILDEQWKDTEIVYCGTPASPFWENRD